MAIEYLLLETTGKILLETSSDGLLLESSFAEPRPIRINTSQGWADIADATCFVSGSGAPTAAVGATGAVYLDTASGRLYGPKTGGAWPGTPITVPAGTDATTSAKGIVQLAGDLAGTAASPQIAAGVIVDADVAAGAAIAEAKLSLASDAAAGTPSRRTLGTGALQAVAGNDSRLLKAAVAYGTSLPASPVDGQEAILVDSTTNPTYQWHFRFNSGSSSTYKWECLGGTPLTNLASAQQPVGPANTALSAAPQVVLPRAGDYSFSWNAMWGTGALAAAQTYIGLWYGGGANANTWSGLWVPTGAEVAVARADVVLTGFAASTTVSTAYQTSVANVLVWLRYLAAMPVRVS